MHNTTRAVIKADTEIPTDRKAGALAYLSGQAEVLLPKLLLTQAEAARALSISRQSLWRLVQENLISPVEIGGIRRYRLADLQRLAAGGAA
jgi:hypothetical protein